MPGDRPAKSVVTPAPTEDAPTAQTEGDNLSREQELRRKLELRQRESHGNEEEETPWYTLFDVDQEDLESVAGWIMRLYQQRSPELDRTVVDLVIGGKKAVRSWVDEHASAP